VEKLIAELRALLNKLRSHKDTGENTANAVKKLLKENLCTFPKKIYEKVDAIKSEDDIEKIIMELENIIAELVDEAKKQGIMIPNQVKGKGQNTNQTKPKGPKI
jgi:hypothetical protein